MDKKVSIIIPCLNSHEILRRQFLYLEKIGIPEDVEIIIVDDGSEPSLEYSGPLPVRIHATNDSRPWTWALARNAGARIAQGEYLLMFDVDHIITRELIDAVREFGGQKMQFKREYGVLTEDGTLTQDRYLLAYYGLPKERKLAFPPLPNNFAMKADIFWQIGGYREDLVDRPYPQGEDRLFKKKWYEWERAGKGNVHTERPTIYMFPNGYLINGDVDFNPMGLFHDLSRKTNSNSKYRKARDARANLCPSSV
jgi:glycosyltransferase involved in cell wall biosynthesis